MVWKSEPNSILQSFLYNVTGMNRNTAFSHGGHIGVPKQWNGGYVGVPNQSCGSWTFFLRKNFLLFQ